MICWTSSQKQTNKKNQNKNKTGFHFTVRWSREKKQQIFTWESCMKLKYFIITLAKNMVEKLLPINNYLEKDFFFKKEMLRFRQIWDLNWCKNNPQNKKNNLQLLASFGGKLLCKKTSVCCTDCETAAVCVCCPQGALWFNNLWLRKLHLRVWYDSVQNWSLFEA